MNWTKNICVVLLATIIPVLSLEFGLRIIFPNKASKNKNIRDHSDPFLPKHVTGYTLQILSTFNKKGFRLNQNNCTKKRTQKKRILIVGDSNIAGRFVSDKEHIGSLLAESLNKDGRDCVQVDTFGVSGFGPDQTLFAIEEFTKKNIYSSVIFHVFADNDLGDLIRNNNPWKNGKLQNNGYCYMVPGILEKSLLFKAVRKALFITTGYWKSASLKHSLEKHELCIEAPYIIKNSFFESLSEGARKEWNAFKKGLVYIYMQDRYDIEFACSTNTTAIKATKKRLHYIFSRFIEISKERTFQGNILIQPSEVDVTTNNSQFSDDLKNLCPKYKKNNLTRLISDTVPKSLPTLNLYDMFINCNECYFSDNEWKNNNHWNKKGIRLAAQEIIKKLDLR